MTAPDDGGVCEIEAEWERRKRARRWLPGAWFVQGLHNRGMRAVDIAGLYGATVEDVEAALSDTDVAEVA